MDGSGCGVDSPHVRHRPAEPGVERPSHLRVAHGKQDEVQRQHKVSSGDSTTFVHAGVRQKWSRAGGWQTRQCWPCCRGTRKLQVAVAQGKTPTMHMGH